MNTSPEGASIALAQPLAGKLHLSLCVLTLMWGLKSSGFYTASLGAFKWVLWILALHLQLCSQCFDWCSQSLHRSECPSPRLYLPSCRGWVQVDLEPLGCILTSFDSRLSRFASHFRSEVGYVNRCRSSSRTFTWLMKWILGMFSQLVHVCFLKVFKATVVINCVRLFVTWMGKKNNTGLKRLNEGRWAH